MINFKQWVEARDDQQSYMGWAEFVQDLNNFLNKNLQKVPEEEMDNAINYVTLKRHNSKKAELDIYLEPFQGPGVPDSPELRKKRLEAIKYYLGEKGISIEKINNHPDPTLPTSVMMIIGNLPRYKRPAYQKNIQNQWMSQSLKAGTVIDVRQVGYEVEPGVFRLNKFTPNVDYVDGKTETHIYSIGRDKSTGEIFAAYDARYYNDPEYDCIYLK